MPLTDVSAKSAKPKDKLYKLFDEKGLFLSVRPNGGKYWQMKYSADKDDKFYLSKDQIPFSIEKSLSKTVLANGGTLLMLATSEGHISVAKELLESGAGSPYKNKEWLNSAINCKRK